MSNSRDLVNVGKWPRFFVIRWYGDSRWGYRLLGKGRHAYDFGRISFIFENCSP